MGHESRIEPWVASFRSACEVSDRIGFVAKGDENRWEGKPKLLDCLDGAAPSETSQFNHVGLEAREAPAVGGVFSLDLPVYRTFF